MGIYFFSCHPARLFCFLFAVYVPLLGNVFFFSLVQYLYGESVPFWRMLLKKQPLGWMTYNSCFKFWWQKTFGFGTKHSPLLFYLLLFPSFASWKGFVITFAISPFSLWFFFSFRVCERRALLWMYARCSLLSQTICPRRHRSLPVPTVFEGWMGTIYVRPMCTFVWPNILFCIFF